MPEPKFTGNINRAGLIQAISNDIDRHLAMMQNPRRWPNWPVLPLINKASRTSSNPFGDEGLLIESGEGKVLPIVYRTNLYLVKDTLATCPRQEFPTLEAILAAGWEVD
jgi:hypothetical protein